MLFLSLYSIGEESFSSGSRPPLTDEATFCVDPIGRPSFGDHIRVHEDTSIDGTTNFVHGFPFVCISLGLIYKKQPVIGVIYNPFLDQMVNRHHVKLFNKLIHSECIVLWFERPWRLPVSSFRASTYSTPCSQAKASSVTLTSTLRRRMGFRP